MTGTAIDVDAISPDARSYAERLARGPHACPNCDAAVWADPPVPWNLRDFVVRCECCARPVQVIVDAQLLLDHAARELQRAGASRAAAGVQAVDLVDDPGARGFARRLAACGFVVVAVFGAAILASLPVVLAAVLATLVIVPSALVAPHAFVWVRSVLAGVHPRLARPGSHGHGAVSVQTARWDQWLREGRIRRSERDPDALLAELALHVDPVELERIRVLMADGAVPVAHLDDLVRFRRSFAARAASIRTRDRSRGRSGHVRAARAG